MIFLKDVLNFNSENCDTVPGAGHWHTSEAEEFRMFVLTFWREVINQNMAHEQDYDQLTHSQVHTWLLFVIACPVCVGSSNH